MRSPARKRKLRKFEQDLWQESGSSESLNENSGKKAEAPKVQTRSLAIVLTAENVQTSARTKILTVEKVQTRGQAKILTIETVQTRGQAKILSLENA